MDLMTYSFLFLMFSNSLIIGVHFGPRKTKCQVTNPVIKEASGLAVSRVHHGVIYTHNDKGGLNEIYAVNLTDCNTVSTIVITSATNWDWEDLSYGPCLDDCLNQPCGSDVQPSQYCIYIADIGDHGGDGPVNNIYVIREPSRLNTTTIDFVGLIKFNWTENDAETLMVTPDGRLYIASKVDGGQAKIAEIPSCAWNFTRVQLDMEKTATLKFHTTSNDPQGGDISPDGRAMVLVGEHGIYFYSILDGDVIKTVNEQIPTQVDTYERVPSSEGIAWSEDGLKFYVIPEGKVPSIYEYSVYMLG